MSVPSVEELESVFRRLDRSSYMECARQPLFAARYWSWEMEREARARYRKGLDNLSEVAIPRFYWRGLSPELRCLFEFASLGKANPELAAEPDLAGLASSQGQPQWTVVARYGRYVVCNHPQSEGRDYVYFGDDTLFLMASARRLTQEFKPERILDLCCGGGGVTLPLSDHLGTVVGIDLNPRAIEVARNCAKAQALANYDFQHGDALGALDQNYDLIVGNPPTLSPRLTGKDAFHATGTMELFLPILEAVAKALEPQKGRALLTVFSTVEGDGSDQTFEKIRALLKGLRGFRYQVRRRYPLGGNRWLRHVALHLLPQSTDTELIPLTRGVQLPGLSWRRS